MIADDRIVGGANVKANKVGIHTINWFGDDSGKFYVIVHESELGRWHRQDVYEVGDAIAG